MKARRLKLPKISMSERMMIAAHATLVSSVPTASHQWTLIGDGRPQHDSEPAARGGAPGGAPGGGAVVRPTRSLPLAAARCC